MPLRSPGQIAQWACVAEATAEKPGNVHGGAAFDDMTWRDMMVSAMVTAPVFDAAVERAVGRTVYDAVAATREAVGVNTNLGIVLLLGPLCAAAGDDSHEDDSLERGVIRVLDALTDDDTRLVYDAIQLAAPGGLGTADLADVHDEPTMGLVDAMRLAADRDAVARQYAEQFHDVFHVIAPRLVALTESGAAWGDAIIRAHVEQMARGADTLIARKCGGQIAGESQRRAADVVAGGSSVEQLDAWLRQGRPRRNPGATADLVTAGIFVAMHETHTAPPLHWQHALTTRP